MPKQTTDTKVIPASARIILAVEGDDDDAFFNWYIRKLGLSGIFVDIYNGKPQLNDYLSVLQFVSGFSNIKTIAIVRDGDLDDTKGVFHKVCTGLERGNLPVPEKIGQLSQPKQGRKSAVFVFEKDGDTPGMLETICLEAISAEKQIGCVDEYLECLASKGIVLQGTQYHKARMQTYLASKHDAELRFQIAVEKNLFKWDHECFDPIKTFLRSLANI
jgi:hypothetical protein